MTITDLTNRRLADPVRLGCFCISGCDDLPIEHVVSDVTDSTVSLTFWFASKKNRPVLVGVAAFRLPDASTAFKEKCDWWTDSRKKAHAKLASGVCLHAQSLEPTFAEAATRHDAFITNKHNVVHIFELDTLGIVLQVHSKDASPDEHPDLLKMIQRIEVNTSTWEETPIKTVASKQFNAIREAPLSSAIHNEIDTYLHKGLDLLNLPVSASPEDRLKTLDTYLNTEERGKKLAAASNQTTLALGAVYASILIDKSNWEWVELTVPELSDAAVTNLVPPNRECYMNPFWVIEQIRSLKKQPNFMLPANMLIAGDFPFDAHYGYVYIG